MISWFEDLRYGLRRLRRSAGFTAVAALTLALGIGANTAIFSLFNSILLSSVPVRDPNHLLILQWFARTKPMSSYGSFGDCAPQIEGSGESGCSFSYPMFQEIRSKTNVFSSVAAFAGPAELALTGSGPASMARGELVSGDYFQTLGVRAFLGRTLERADEAPGAAPVAVLSYAYWINRFAGDASAVGRAISLNHVPFVIVGVAEPRFTRLTPGKSQDMWLPLTLSQRLGVGWDGPVTTSASDPQNDSGWWLAIVARSKPGRPLRQAAAAVNLVFRNALLDGAKPLFKDADQPGVALVPAQRGLTGIRAGLEEPLYILLAMVGLILVIACTNVAGLMLARATGREKEMAVRFALGAARGRIIRQLLTESALLSTFGAAVGVVLAVWAARSLGAFLVANWPWPLELKVQLDGRVLSFTVAITMLAAMMLGIVPALRTTGVEVVPALKENAGNGSAISGALKGRFRLGDSLVIGQVALSVLVLAIASLLGRTLVNLKKIDPGFDPRQVLLFGINPTLAGYPKPQIRDLYRDLQDRLAALPGVSSVSYSSDALLNGGLWTGQVHVAGQSAKSEAMTQMLAVGPRFFATMRIPLLAGRAFVQSDLGSAQPVAIVNQAFARQFLAGRNPVGSRIGRKAGDKDIENEIIGVVADTKYDQLNKAIGPTAYLPVEGGKAYFEVRAASSPAGLIRAVRQVVSDRDNNLPLLDVRTQSEMVDRLLFNQRLVASLSGLFAVLAILLVCVGLYGLLSYEVSRRTREIGIRSALGAERRDLLLLVVGQGITVALVGLAIGVVAALGVTRSMQSMLYGVRPTDPFTYVATALLVVMVALLACYLPARRAAGVDPMVALRYE
jgi:predicted permease